MDGLPAKRRRSHGFTPGHALPPGRCVDTIKSDEGRYFAGLPVKLKNPPVVEAWIDFRFDMDENAERWGADKAVEVLHRMYAGRFIAKAASAHRMINLRPFGDAVQVDEVRTFFESIRAAGERGDEHVVIGQQRFAYAVTKSAGTDWIGFRHLLDQTMEGLEKFGRFAAASRIRSIALHYVDDVYLPGSPGVELDIAKFLTIRPEIPQEGFGSVTEFAFRVAFPVSERPEEAMTVQAQSLPPLAGRDAQVAFRMDWHHSWDTITAPDNAAIKEFLSRAHDRQTKAFRQAFTEAGFNLFGPEDCQC